MKISTKTRYGLRALVDLAVHFGGEQVPLQHIATRQKVSVHYLEQIFSLLKRANIVKSIKGAQGGYVLLKRPSEITVGQIIRIIEGEITIVDEDLSEASLTLCNMQKCIKENVWDKVTESIYESIDKITLEDLTKDYQCLTINESIMYYI